MKGYLKELEKIKADSEYYERALKLLSDLYSLICEACQYYLFSTDDPFHSIGWLQEDFYHLVATKAFEGGYTREKIARMAELAGTNEQWIDIYKYGLIKKIKPRESLIHEYQARIKENGENEEDSENKRYW